jgi:hypothetical protein
MLVPVGKKAILKWLMEKNDLDEPSWPVPVVKGPPPEFLICENSMTLILNAATHDCVIRVSDRRLTDVRTGGILEDNRNKVTLFGNRLAFGYTGLAAIGPIPMDEWITKILSDPATTSGSKACYRLRDQATRVFKSIGLSETQKRHAFCAAGWTCISANEWRSIIVTISNAIDDKGYWMSKAENEFKVRYTVLEPSKPIMITPTGQAVNLKSLSRSIRQCLERDALSPQSLGRLLVACVRETAKTNATVGKNLLFICLPKKAVTAQPGGTVTLLFSGPLSEVVTSLYLPEGSSDGVQYGPNLAAPGVGLTGAQGGSVWTTGRCVGSKSFRVCCMTRRLLAHQHHQPDHDEDQQEQVR